MAQELNYHYLGGGGPDGSDVADDEAGVDGVMRGVDASSDVAASMAGGAGIRGNCSTLSCELGVCVDGACVCATNIYGPRCTLRGPPPSTFTALDSIIIGPHGADTHSCGSARAPCATLRHALARQFWQSYGGLASGLRWERVGNDPPNGGSALSNARLAAALVDRCAAHRAAHHHFSSRCSRCSRPCVLTPSDGRGIFLACVRAVPCSRHATSRA